jgi:hypothetical protein
MSKLFTISSAYEWGKVEDTKISHSELAIKTMVNYVKNRFSDKKNSNLNYKINYRRLRASAGKTMLDSIIKRIESSNVVIIDITSNNRNVFLEAGIALTVAKKFNNISVYFIREYNSNKKLLEGIPSDLQGYFISEYSITSKGIATFKDQNSLRMSLESDIKDYFNDFNDLDNFNQIDEINTIEKS